MRSLRRQQGVVIVVALFFVALVATIAYLMMARLERDTRRTSLLLRNTQAEFYAQGSIDWAKAQLRDNFNNQKPNQVVDKMPLKSAENEEQGYRIASVIYDMQSRLNVNHVMNAEGQADFKRLLHIVSPLLDANQVATIQLSVLDWIMPGDSMNEKGKYYLTLSPPYRAAHRMMISASELQLVEGMTPALYASLAPYISALPTVAPVNVQTASAPVLASLSESMTLDTGKAIEQIRQQQNFPTIEAFLNLDIMKNHKISADKITILSQYFLVETTVKIEKQKVVLYTLLERTGKDGKSTVNVIWQSKGVMG